MDCTNDDDDHRSQKLADSRERAAPWQATTQGGPTKMKMVINCIYYSDI